MTALHKQGQAFCVPVFIGMSYAYDGQGRGILTKAEQIPTTHTLRVDTGGGISPQVTNGIPGYKMQVPTTGTDAFARVTAETSNDSARFFVAEGLSPATAANLSLAYFDKTNVGWTGTPQKWQAPLRVRPSAQPYSLSVSTGAAPEQNATVQFGMARRAAEAVALTLDDEGKVTRRVLGGNRVQDLTWDGLGRLVRVIEHLVAASSSVSEPSYAYRWTARYDGLGRRVLARTEWGWWNKTAQTFTPGLIGAGAGGPPASGSIAALALSTRATVVEESFHDPLVEFLEIAVETRVIGQGTAGNAGYVQASRTRAWKVHGPDANGAYGGLQGIGGLEAVYEERALGTVAQAPSWTGVIDDYYGHIIATVAGEVVSESALRYHETKSIGYGPAPDSPVHYLSEGASLTQSTAWRGKRQDITGYFYLGARYYEPSSARFLSTDPMGHGASMSLYDYAGGDPINFVDPTGRLQTSTRLQSVGERFAEGWEKLKAAPGLVSTKVGEGLIKFNTNPDLSAWYMQPVKWLGQFTIGFGGAGAMANPLMISGGVGATADAVDQLGTRVVLNAIGDGIVTSLQEARDNPIAASGSLFAGLGGSGLLGKLSTLGSRNVLAGTISQLDNLSLDALEGSFDFAPGYSQGLANRSMRRELGSELKSLGVALNITKEGTSYFSPSAMAVTINKLTATPGTLLDEFTHAFSAVRGKGAFLPVDEALTHQSLARIARQVGTDNLGTEINTLYHQLELKNFLNSGAEIPGFIRAIPKDEINKFLSLKPNSNL